jgi:hypothetical protein
MSSNDDGYMNPNNVAETANGQHNSAVRLLTVCCLYFDSPPEAPKNWWQMNRNFKNNHSGTIESSHKFRILDDTNWRHQQEEIQ